MIHLKERIVEKSKWKRPSVQIDEETLPSFPFFVVSRLSFPAPRQQAVFLVCRADFTEF